MIVVKQASDTVVDVFTGKGWSNWTRFEVQHKQGKLHLRLVKGSPMSKEDFHNLYEDLSK